jgi:hypothetical protein
MTTEHGQRTETELREGITYKERVGAWTVTFWWPAEATTGGPRGVYVEPAEDADPQEVARGISTTVLRQINIAEAAENVGPLLGKVQGLKETFENAQEVFSRLLSKGITDEYLAFLSVLYVKSVDSGRRAPIQDLATLSGRNQATLKGHLREARKRQILTKVEGKAGGQLTEKAKRLLEGLLSGEGAEEVRLPE